MQTPIIEPQIRNLPVVQNKNPRIAVIRTSDRIAFKACRRKWDFSSHLRQNMEPVMRGNPLWLGSGMHYALEDFHGENYYGSASKAFQAYAWAFNKVYPKKMPDDYMELTKLATEMMDYYPIWLTGRDPLKTFIYDGKPQVEVNIKIPIPFELLEPHCDKDKFKRIRDRYDEVYYSMQLDRVIESDMGDLWILEYKSAARMETGHFMLDPQVSTYVWGANLCYGRPVAGVIYQQHRKDLPKAPRELVNGTFSVAQNQLTSHRLYRKALIDKYGEVNKAPNDNIKYLNDLAARETADYDLFIRRDKVFRNDRMCENVAQNILLEACDMLDPSLPLYHNPTRMCSTYCSFMSPCISMDDGSDWQQDLADGYELRPDGYDTWRVALPDPETFTGIKLS